MLNVLPSCGCLLSLLPVLGYSVLPATSEFQQRDSSMTAWCWLHENTARNLADTQHEFTEGTIFFALLTTSLERYHQYRCGGICNWSWNFFRLSLRAPPTRASFLSRFHQLQCFSSCNIDLLQGNWNALFSSKTLECLNGSSHFNTAVYGCLLATPFFSYTVRHCSSADGVNHPAMTKQYFYFPMYSV